MPLQDSAKRMKRQSNKGLVSRIYLELSKLNRKKTIQLEKRTKDMKRHFINGDTQMKNKQMKICSVSLAIRGMQIKTSLRYH